METTAPMRDRDQRPVAQPDDGRGVDAVQQFPGLFGVEHGGLAGLHHMLRIAAVKERTAVLVTLRLLPNDPRPDETARDKGVPAQS
jgi:hypothetical protein